MGRLVMMLGLVMLGVLVAAGAAVAVNKICSNNLPCEGTDRERHALRANRNRQRDRIFGFDRNDVINANTFDRDRDTLRGDAGRDKLLTNDTDNRDVAKEAGAATPAMSVRATRPGVVKCCVERRLERAPATLLKDAPVEGSPQRRVERFIKSSRELRVKDQGSYHPGPSSCPYSPKCVE